MQSSSDLRNYRPTAAGPATPRRPTLTRMLPTIQSDSSTSLLANLPSVSRRPTGKSLPARPISNLRDYMPPSASRSSWRGMPFSQFQDRLLQDAATATATANPPPDPAPTPTRPPPPPEPQVELPAVLIAPMDMDATQLQAYLSSLVKEMNTKRRMLDLPAWKVPNDLSLMRHVCKIWWGEQVTIPELNRADNGQYEVDYEVMKKEREIEEKLLDSNEPLIDINITPEQERARAKARSETDSFLWIKDNYGWYGVETYKRTKLLGTEEEEVNDVDVNVDVDVGKPPERIPKPSVLAVMWVNLGYMFRIPAKRRRSRYNATRWSTKKRTRTRMSGGAWRLRR